MCCREPMWHPRWGWGPSRARWGGPPWWACPCEEEAEEQAPFDFRRHFESKANVAERLERYLQALEAESEAVRERLAELRGSA
ncbi:MAG: hypothetical protein AB1566_14700 [Chloroflexota bacterium]